MNKKFVLPKIILSSSPDPDGDLPDLSVVLFDYINHKYTIESIESLVKQDFPKKKFEVIVLTDDSAPYCIEFLKNSKLRCTVIYTGLVPIGQSFSVAMQFVQGQIICPLDNDDLFEPNRLSIIDNLFKENRNLVFLKNEVKPFSRYYSGKSLAILYFLKMNIPLRCKGGNYLLTNKTPRWVYGRAILHNSSSMAVRRVVLETNRKSVEELIAFPDSFIFFASALSGGDCLFMDLPLTLYSVEKGSSTRRDHKGSESNKSRSELALLHHLRFFFDGIERAENTNILDLFQLFKTSTKILIFLSGAEDVIISNQEIWIMLRTSIRFRSHNFIILVAFYLLARIKMIRNIMRVVYDALI
jgi:glycosyltransferase involved in cell wall biosynthesis